MSGSKRKPLPNLLLVAVYAVTSAIITIYGIYHIRNLRESMYKTWENELIAFTDLKSRQVVRWWHERIGDAIVLRSNPALMDQVRSFVENEYNPGVKEALAGLFTAYLNTFDYKSIFLINREGKVVLKVPGNTSFNGIRLSPLIPLLPEEYKNRKVILTDIYRSGIDGSNQMDLIFQVDTQEDLSLSESILIIFMIDPEKLLFPLLKSWTTPGNSSESYLIKVNGDSVIYLNHQGPLTGNDFPLSRYKAGDWQMFSQLAANKFDGTAEGKDYRDVDVLASIKPIHGSNWYIVTTIDRDEVDNAIREHCIPFILLLVFVIFSFGALVGWFIWHQRVRYYKQRYNEELQQRALKKHSDFVLKYANDIILLLDGNLRIIELNEHATIAYQYSRSELIGKNIVVLRLPEFDEDMKHVLDKIDNEGNITFETVHRRKDGTTFPLEISARLFEIDGSKYYQAIARDITERKKAEAKLNRLIDRYNTAIQAGGLAVWEWDTANNKLIWEDKVYELFGVDKNEIDPVYESWLDIVVHPDDRKETDRRIKYALAGKMDYDTEFRVIQKDGSVKHIKAFGKIILSQSGSPERMIGINYDITRQKDAEKLLRERSFWLNESQKVGRIGSYILDIQTLTWTSSETLDEIFGIDDNFERTLEGWGKLLHPEIRNEMLQYLRRHVIDEKNFFDRDYRIINHRTGRELWLYGRGELRFDETGNPVKMIGTIHDITDRKLVELSLHITEQTYSNIFNAVSDAIYIHRPDGVFIDVNQGAVKMYGYQREELIGMSPSLVSAPGKNDLELVNFIIKRVFETGVSEQFEFWGKRKNGEVFPKEVVANRGKYFGQDVIIATARDITLRKSFEDQLRKARDMAEESDRLKTAFLHNISHEIRTPMNAIVGFTSLLEEPDLDPANRKHFTDIIYQSTNQLLGIISDIVDISNIETGQVKLNYSEVNLNELVRDLYEQYLITAGQQKLILHYETGMQDGNSNIYTDRIKLVQILSNLLNNAIKFTRHGSVQFGYRINSELEFFVKDTGIGIPDEKQSSIFDRFYQVDADSSRKYPGAGLGLSICKAYVELLGGRISVKSTPGKGSEFVFTHPL